MNIFRKLDRIPPPYSTVLALAIPSLLGLVVVFLHDGELRLLGIGIITGAFFAIILKKAAEVSDRAVLSSILGMFRGNKRSNSE